MTLEEVNEIFTIAEGQMRNGNLSEAENLCRKMIDGLAVDLSVPAVDEHSRERLRLRMSVENFYGVITWRQGKYAHSLEHFDIALSISLAENDMLRYAKTLGNIATVHKNLSNFTLSIEFYEKAIAIDRHIGNQFSLAISLANLGNVYYFLADYPRALEMFSQALVINEQLDTKEQIIGNTCNIANVYLGLFDNQRAYEYYKKALSMAQQEQHLQFEANITGNIGVVYENNEDYVHALEMHKSALALHNQIQDTSGSAGCIANIGRIYSRLRDYQSAIEYLIQSKQLYTELANKAGIAESIADIGRLYAEEMFDGYDEATAEANFLEALHMFRQLEMKQRIYECHLSLAELYEKLERWKEHAHHFRNYHLIEKEVMSEDAKKQSDKFFYEKKLAEEAARGEATDAILNNILPPAIASRLKNKELTIADKQDNVSVFFSDIVGFTKLSQSIEPEALVSTLNKIFSRLDILARKHSIEKIKTIGDAYMAVCGVPEPNEYFAHNMARFAIEVQDAIGDIAIELGIPFQVRIGLHCGSVIAGVIGENKFAYDLWGDAVNTASRMESHGEPGKIHVSEDFKNAILVRTGRDLSVHHDLSFHFIDRGEMDIKGKGFMKTYFLEKAGA